MARNAASVAQESSASRENENKNESESENESASASENEEIDVPSSSPLIAVANSENVISAITTRASQTVLTSSRGLVVAFIGAQTATEAASVAAASAKSSDSIVRHESGRSSVEIPRLAVSAQPREIVTLTMDYESLSPTLANGHRDASGPSSREIGTRRDRATDSPPPTIYSFAERRRRPRRRRLVFACCGGRGGGGGGSAFEESDRRSPPAYSALYPRFGRGSDQDLRIITGAARGAPVLIDANRISSFVARTPPPSYAQAQGICIAYSLEQLISNSDSNGRIWSPRPTTAVCPRCATLVITVVNVQQATATHITALALCIMGCWPCCMLPYCIDSCKTSHHYCPFCRAYLGTYTPW